MLANYQSLIHSQKWTRKKKRRLYHHSISPLPLMRLSSLHPPMSADDFKQFQELFCRIADSFQIPLEEVKEEQDNQFDILHAT